MHPSPKDRYFFAVVLRHLTSERKFADIKVRDNNISVFPPYILDGSGAGGHMTYHASGERHATFRANGRSRVCKDSVCRFKPPVNLTGALPLYRSGDVLGQFQTLDPVTRWRGTKIVLDLEKAGFVEEFFGMTIYAVERGNEGCVPPAPCEGLRVLHFVKTTDPWIAVDVYQPQCCPLRS